ncbi:MAG: RtcB family protein, partial [Desulfococcaceae bacterium]
MSIELKPIDDYRWELPQTGAMQAPGRIYGTKKLVDALQKEGSLKQVANVATLPGILDASLAMPDAHQGYGFTIGGVAAFDWETGIVSPGGVGYDINCGVRLVRSDILANDIKPKMRDLANQLFRDLPVGVGVGGPNKFSDREIREICSRGAEYLRDQGLATQDDLDATESNGCLQGADPDA